MKEHANRLQEREVRAFCASMESVGERDSKEIRDCLWIGERISKNRL